MGPLGGIVYKCASSPLLSIDKNDVGLAWCRELIRRSWDWDSAVSLNYLTTAMLITEPDRRIPTRKCWEEALQLSVSSQNRSSAPIYINRVYDIIYI